MSLAANRRKPAKLCGPPIMDKSTATPQHSQSPLKVLVRHAIEHVIDAVWFRLAEHLHKILGAVVDRDRSVFGQDVVLALRRKAIHL